jgi:hypothetical protein
MLRRLTVVPEPRQVPNAAGPALPLLERVRRVMRSRHYSPRTETAYVDWIRRFILFHQKRHPDTMGEGEVSAFLSSLATGRGVSASTQNQALAALLLLYQQVLGRRLHGWTEWCAPRGRSGFRWCSPGPRCAR